MYLNDIINDKIYYFDLLDFLQKKAYRWIQTAEISYKTTLPISKPNPFSINK